MPLTLLESVVCERELETEQNCNILTSTLLAIRAFLSRSPGLLNRGLGGPLCWVLVFSTASHSTHPRSRLYSDIPRPDAPVIYTCAFPILTARPGRRSIYNKLLEIEIFDHLTLSKQITVKLHC